MTEEKNHLAPNCFEVGGLKLCLKTCSSLVMEALQMLDQYILRECKPLWFHCSFSLP